MPKTIQIRDIEDEVYFALVRRAAEAGLTVPEFLRKEIARMTSRPTVAEWLARTGRRPSNITPEHIQEAIDELRGPWPNADC